MKFFTARLTISLSVLYLVTSESPLDAIIDIRPHPTNDSTANKFVYFEQVKLTVKCSLRTSPYPEGIQLNLFYDIAERNPVFGQKGLPEVEREDEKTLEIQFWPNIFIPLINFTCTSKQLIETKWQILSTDNLLVEQLYRTYFVKIVDHQNNDVPKVITIDSDESVELKCLADGNPLPEHYQWYNRTENGDVQLADQIEAIFQFVPPSEWASQNIIFCATKNKFNKEYVKSATITVTSHYFPRLEFTSVPIPSNMSTSHKLVFMESAKVEIECHLATASPPSDIYTKIKMNNYEPNPAYPRDDLDYRISDTPTRIIINYNLRRVIPLVNISCHAVNKTTGHSRKISTILIEQQYRTSTAFLTTDIRSYVVDAGETVILECLADGNPKPNFQWYYKTRHGYDRILVNATDPVLEIVTPSNWTTDGWYSCYAKNKYNDEDVPAVSEPVTSVYYPTPVFKTTPSPTLISTSKKFSFLEESRVVVECTFPDQQPFYVETSVKMVLEGYEKNPLFPIESSGITEHPKELKMDIVFNPEKFISVVNISCHVDNKYTKKRKRSTNILIEQQYKTTNVLINGKDQTVYAGKMVKLVCLADGNPKPDYQWYNRTENTADVKIKNAIQPVLEILTPSSQSTIGIYTCGAKNKYNLFINKGKPVSVNSAFLTPPSIATNSTPINSTDNNFVFFEEPVLILTCYMPLDFSVSNLISLKMKYGVDQIPNVEKSPKVSKDWDDLSNPTMKIEYNPNSFPAVVKVTCDASYNSATETKTIQVVQLSKTRNVLVSGPSRRDGNSFWLSCAANGYPRPQIQWFKETRDGFEAIENETNQFLSLDSKKMAVDTTFMCGAKNEYNIEFATSDPKKVTKDQITD